MSGTWFPWHIQNYLAIFFFVSIIITIFAFKYCRCVVNGKATAKSLSAGWRYDFSWIITITALADYSVHLET